MGSMLSGIGPVLLAFLAGALAIIIATTGNYLPWQNKPPEEKIEEQTELIELRLEALSIFLRGQADWIESNPALVKGWSGDLVETESLVQWNAAIVDGVESIGLCVLSGHEEIIPRRNRLPIQQLTLVIGDEVGDYVTTVCVRKPRRGNLLVAF